MEDFLLGTYPWLLWGLMALWAALLLACRKDFSRLFKGLLDLRGLLLLLAALSAYGLARPRLCPLRHLVLENEFRHMDIAANMQSRGVFGESLAKGRPGLDAFAVPAWPGAHHAGLALSFRVFGPTEATAYAWSNLLGGAAVGLAFLCSLALFKSRAAAFASGLLMALHPLLLRYASATDAMPSALAWTLAFVLTLALDAETRSRESHGLAVVTLLLAMHARFENALLAPLGWWYLRAAPRHGEEHHQPQLYAAFGALAAPLAFLFLRARQAESIGVFAPDLSSNLPGNLLYLVTGPGGPLVFLLLPLSLKAKGSRLKVRSLLGLAAVFLAAHSAFLGGDFSLPGQERHALVAATFLALAAGAGAAELWGRGWGKAALAALLALAPLEAARRAAAPPAGRLADEAAFLASAAPALPPEACVIAYAVPKAVAMTGRCAVSPYVLLGSPEPAAWEKQWGPLVLFEDTWYRRREPDSRRLKELLETRWRLALAARTGFGSDGPLVWRLASREAAPQLRSAGRARAPRAR